MSEESTMNKKTLLMRYLAAQDVRTKASENVIDLERRLSAAKSTLAAAERDVDNESQTLACALGNDAIVYEGKVYVRGGLTPAFVRSINVTA